jgi:hypothetical protein
MPNTLIEDTIEISELAELAKERFGDLIKAVVDVKRSVMMVGAELHADQESLFLEQGSRQQDLWGINLYPRKTDDEWIEFDSMINLRPSQNNFSRGVDNPEVRKKIIEIVYKLVRVK